MKPRVILHNAVSLDGRTDKFYPDIGIFYRLAGRWREDATLVGADTLLAAPAGAEAQEGEEPPQLDPVVDTRPLLVAVDSRGRVSNWSALRRAPHWRGCLALGCASTPPAYREDLARVGVGWMECGRERVDLGLALEELNARHGVCTVRVDSGGTLNGALLRAGLVDEVSVLLHPCLVGGRTPASMFRSADLDGPEGALSLRLDGVERVGRHLLWLRYGVVGRLERAQASPGGAEAQVPE